VPASAVFWSDIGKPRKTGAGCDHKSSRIPAWQIPISSRHPVVYHNTRPLFYLTTLVCHFPPLGRRACGRLVEWVKLTECTSRHKAFISLRKHTAAVLILMPSVFTAGCLLQVTRQDVAFRDDHQDHHDHDVVCYHPQQWLPQDTRWAAQTGADGMTSLSDADCIHPLVASYLSSAASVFPSQPSLCRHVTGCAAAPDHVLSLPPPPYPQYFTNRPFPNINPFSHCHTPVNRLVFQLSSVRRMLLASAVNIICV